MDKVNIPNVFMSANWFDEDRMKRLILAAMQAGVRGFDTAREYKAERKIGNAIKFALRETGLKREDIFVQTRISNQEIINGHISKEIEKSLDKLNLDYIDCFMFHWPTPDYFQSSWEKLLDYKQSHDTVKSTGLCNCRLRHLVKMQNSGVELPQIIQIEIQPFWQAKDVVAFCQDREIAIEAFSPLCKMIPAVKNNEILQMIARKHGVDIARVILRWHTQRGVSPISLTSKPERIFSNFDLNFELDDDDMYAISLLDSGYKYHLESATCVGF